MRVLITGGAGFIGVNAAARFLAKGWQVDVVDNLSRPKVEANLEWLQAQPSAKQMTLHRIDVRDAAAINEALTSTQPDLVLHLAAQVAVTTSVLEPRHDFEVNAIGTFNVLEAARQMNQPPAFIYASTNKVYGKLSSVKVVKEKRRYRYQDLPRGVAEDAALDFYSPYGCSKGAADQYVVDYARIYGLRTVAMRQSCIYGRHQFGVEDQGWLAWFAIASVTGKPITIYGDGLQVRDVLWVDDLVDLYELAFEQIDRVSGKAFNVGGGAAFSLSLLESLDVIGRCLGREIPVSYADWRPGDQEVFIADTSLAKKLLGWAPKTSPDEGVAKLMAWIQDNRALLD